MPHPANDATDERLDQALGHLLRGGVILAASVALLGGLAYLAKSWNAPVPNYHAFHEETEMLRHPSGILQAALRLDTNGIIQLGVLLLIATPVARVIFTVFAFARQRDWAYVVITLIVLGLLLFGLLRQA